MIHFTPPNSRRAFTAVELILSLALLAIIASAIGGFVMAVAQSWRSSSNLIAVQSVSTQVSMRLERALASALYIGAAGPAIESTADSEGRVTHETNSLLIWQHDEYPEGTGTPQAAEMAVLQFDANEQVLRLISPRSPDQLTEPQREVAEIRLLGINLTPATTSVLQPTTQLLSDVVALLLGQEYMDQVSPVIGGTSGGTRATDAVFTIHYDPDGRARRVDYRVSYIHEGQPGLADGSLALRAPRRKPE